MTIKAIVFDIGGVLVKKIYRKLIEEISSRYNIDLEELKSFASPEWKEKTMQGKITEAEHFEHIAKHFNILLTKEQAEKDLRKIEIINDVWLIINKLEGKYKLAILSDQGKLGAKIREEALQLSKRFDPILYSCDVGVNKPDPKIFKLFLEKINLPANECIFIDDFEENIEAARKEGMEAILFKDPEQLKQDLIKQGINLE